MAKKYKTFKTARFLIKHIWRVKVHGFENVPSDGGLLICSNHTSIIDPVFVTYAMFDDYDLRFMAKKELFGFKPFARLIEWLGAFPVDRESADIKSVRLALSILKQGGRMMVFPEGTRYKDGELHEAKSGVGMFALRSGVPVLPVYTAGKKHLFAKVHVVFGRPEVLTFAGGKKAGAEEYKRCADAIMAMIARTKEEFESKSDEIKS